jgi:membrane-bound serine protease (ClpP class)
MKRFGVIAVLGLLLGVRVHAAQVGLVKIEGAIGPATASFISRALDTAAAENDECLIIQLDTPGGLVTSMQDIVKKFFASPLPVVVYVAPDGATATSAGCYITMAADIAAMSPKTTIGAAHVVVLEGGDEAKTDDVMKQKLENFGVSYIEMIATNRNRNAEWAKAAARESVSITAQQALNLKVIDLLATNLPSLLKQLDGRKVGGKTLLTANATVVEIQMNAWERFSQLFLRPEIMFILMLMVIYGFMGELSSPGAILPGVVGAIALVLVLYMSAILPVNVAGLLLIGLAVLLFIADTYASTHGVLTTGGIVAFFLGALMLFNHAGPGYHLSLRWIIPATLLTAAFFIFVVGKGLGAQFKPAQTGAQTMIGKIVNAQSRIDSAGGKVFIEGEIWNAVCDSAVAAGQMVEITGIEGLTLKVKPTN